jgi:hypothetical protein
MPRTDISPPQQKVADHVIALSRVGEPFDPIGLANRANEKFSLDRPLLGESRQAALGQPSVLR